jgi:uncharacterized membrane protein
MMMMIMMMIMIIIIIIIIIIIMSCQLHYTKNVNYIMQEERTSDNLI